MTSLDCGSMMVFVAKAAGWLVVDDVHYVREVVAEILTRDGAKVTGVGSAKRRSPR